MRAVAIASLVLLVSAGCFTTAEEPVPVDEAASGTVTIDESRPDPTFADVALGPIAAPDLNATLDAPPRLVPGEWWRIHLTSPLTGEDVTFIRVVAAVDGDVYLIGMPHEGWYKEAVIYHTPAFGDVGMDLSFTPHDVPFAPLKFPLTDGATWDTHWQSTKNPLKATVKVDSPTQATVTFQGRSCTLVHGLANGGGCPDGSPLQDVMTLVYDATQHEIISFKEASVQYEVLEHGYGFEGWITIPRGEDLVFFHGRFGPIDLSTFGLNPLPTETVEVQGGFNRISFFLATGGGLGSGVYRETVTAPDGQVYSLESMPPGTGLKTQFFEGRDPDGTWSMEHIAGGAGLAFIEGIAYHQYDIRLPDGARRADHSHEVVR